MDSRNRVESICIGLLNRDKILGRSIELNAGCLSSQAPEREHISLFSLMCQPGFLFKEIDGLFMSQVDIYPFNYSETLGIHSVSRQLQFYNGFPFAITFTNLFYFERDSM